MSSSPSCFFFFFFNDTATTEIYTLSLHDALPICILDSASADERPGIDCQPQCLRQLLPIESLRAPRRLHRDRKSTRLNSSHQIISYAVFCLKKKNKTQQYKSDMLNATTHHRSDLH